MQCNASLHAPPEESGQMKIVYLLPSEMPLAWLGDQSRQHAVPAGLAAPRHMIASQLALPLHAPPMSRICISHTLDFGSLRHKQPAVQVLAGMQRCISVLG